MTTALSSAADVIRDLADSTDEQAFLGHARTHIAEAERLSNGNAADGRRSRWHLEQAEALTRHAEGCRVDYSQVLETNPGNPDDFRDGSSRRGELRRAADGHLERSSTVTGC